MKTVDKILTLLALLFSASFVYLSAHYIDIYNSFAGIDVLLWLCIGADMVIFAACVFRLLYTMNDPDKFRAQVLIPGITALICGVLAFVLSPIAENAVLQKDYKHNKQLYRQAVEYLDTQPHDGSIDLPDEFAHLSYNGKATAFVCDNGQHTCYLFAGMENEGRIEGIMYVSGEVPVIYYDIVDRFVNYEFKDMGGGYVYIVLYK